MLSQHLSYKGFLNMYYVSYNSWELHNYALLGEETKALREISDKEIYARAGLMWRSGPPYVIALLSYLKIAL